MSILNDSIPGVLRQGEHKIVNLLDQAIPVPRTLSHQQHVNHECENDQFDEKRVFHFVILEER
jgi:hypothetical protein